MVLVPRTLAAACQLRCSLPAPPPLLPSLPHRREGPLTDEDVCSIMHDGLMNVFHAAAEGGAKHVVVLSAIPPANARGRAFSRDIVRRARDSAIHRIQVGGVGCRAGRGCGGTGGCLLLGGHCAAASKRDVRVRQHVCRGGGARSSRCKWGWRARGLASRASPRTSLAVHRGWCQL